MEARCAGADCRRRGRRRRHPPSPSGAARRTRRARTRDVRFVKGGVARAERRPGQPPPNGFPPLRPRRRQRLVTYHRRGVAGRWRRVGEKIALEDDRLDAVIAKLLFMAGVSAPSAGTDCRRRRPTGSSRCSSSPHDRTANGVDGELAPRAGSREPAVDDLVVVGDGRRRTGPRPRRTAGGDRQVVAITGPKRSGRTRTC